MDKVLSDLENVILKEKCNAKVQLSDGTSLPDDEVILESKADIMDSVKASISLSSNSAHKIFEWSKIFDDAHEQSIIIYAISGSLILYIVTALPKKVLNLSKVSLASEVLGDKVPDKFEPFPSIHHNIVDCMNYHSEGYLLKSTYVFGLDRAEFPEKIFENPRILSTNIEKIVGTPSVTFSEIAINDHKGIISYNDLGLVNQFHIIPYDKFEDRNLALNLVGSFMFTYLTYEGSLTVDEISQKYFEDALDHLRMITRIAKSQPIALGGAFESLIAKLEAQGKVKLNKLPHIVQGSIKGQEQLSSLDAVAGAITKELSRITNVELKLETFNKTEKNDHTLVEFMMSFQKGATPTLGDLSEGFPYLVNALVDLLSKEKSVPRINAYMVESQHFLLLDGILITVDVQWRDPRSYKSLKEFGVSLANEVGRTTNLNLTFEKFSQNDNEKYTIIDFALSYIHNKNTSEVPSSDNLKSLIEMLADYLADKRGVDKGSIHSIRHRIFLLEDAFLLIVKVNWTSYIGEDDISMWDV